MDDGLRKLIESSQKHQTASDLLGVACDLYEKFISHIPVVLQLGSVVRTKVLNPKDAATDGQRRRLLCLYLALLKALFTVFWDTLNSAPICPSSQETIPQNLSTVKMAMNTSDKNFRRLRRNHKVWKRPRVWASVLTAHALLSLALARICLAPLGETQIELLTSVASNLNRTQRASLARSHLDHVRDLQHWIWSLQREKCKLPHGALAPWREDFFALLDVVEAAIEDYRAGGDNHELYCQPMYANISLLKLEWGDQFVDLEVDYNFVLHY